MSDEQKTELESLKSEENELSNDHSSQDPIQDSRHLLSDHAVDEEQTVTTEEFNIPSPVIVTKKKRISSKKAKILISLIIACLIGAGVFMYLMLRDEDADQQITANQEQTQNMQFGVAVGMLEGSVQYSTDDTTWQELKSDTDLKEGDSVKTGDSSKVVLLIDDGSAVRLDAGTEVNLKSLATEDVRIDNVKGQVYTRVVASESRRFGVYADGELYLAKGTAYRTISTDAEKGVQVFHSKVEVGTKQTEVGEGNAFFTKSGTKEKEGVVSALDVEALKDDSFIKWNAEQDKSEQAFADKLGVLVDIDKPKAVAETPQPTPAPSTAAKSGITLKGSQSDYSAVFSWTVTGVDTSGGFKLVRSASSKTPTYPDNGVVYIEKGKTSYTLTDKDGGTYYYRLCAYRNGACTTYSNAVSVTTNAKPKPEVSTGTITLSLVGTTASWSDTGKAGNGYKLVMSTAPSPVYPGAEIAKYLTETTKTLPDGLVSGSTYYIRVCRYTNEGTCTDYSNELTYLAP